VLSKESGGRAHPSSDAFDDGGAGTVVVDG
jgi:hypothetical protein